MAGMEKKKPGSFRMKVNVRRLPKNSQMFEFIISTPTLKSQFILPRHLVNELRVLIEKVLLEKKNDWGKEGKSL